MEGKAMKKKIILFLSFLMIAMCLTGCSVSGTTNVTPEEIKYMTEVAQNIKDNSDYELPEGYTFELEDNTKNGRIIIKTKTEINDGQEIRAYFDITKDSVELIQIKAEYWRDNTADMLSIGIIFLIIGGIIGFAIGKTV